MPTVNSINFFNPRAVLQLAVSNKEQIAKITLVVLAFSQALPLSEEVSSEEDYRGYELSPAEAKYTTALYNCLSDCRSLFNNTCRVVNCYASCYETIPR
ncbi:MAG: hypothetical protein ACRCU0_04580 [Candidatus Rhabdochlamydia sp.]